VDFVGDLDGSKVVALDFTTAEFRLGCGTDS